MASAFALSSYSVAGVTYGLARVRFLTSDIRSRLGYGAFSVAHNRIHKRLLGATSSLLAFRSISLHFSSVILRGCSKSHQKPADLIERRESGDAWIRIIIF